jgi:hemolysin D
MNGPSNLPVPAKKISFPAILKSRVPRDHLEFLPANLEILETPSSPKASLFLWVLCAMLAAAIAWSWFARLDIHAVAKGKVQPSGRSKIVQTLDPGKVRTINVTNGARVKAGEVVLELDPTDSEADRKTLADQLEWLNAEIVRRTAAIEAVNNQNDTPEIAFPPSVSESVQVRERSAFLADLGQYIANRESLVAQRGQQIAMQQRLTMSIEAREKLLASLKERVNMKESLVSVQSGTRASVIDALQTMQGEQTNIAYDKGQLLEAQAGTVASERKIWQSKQEFIAKQTQEYLDSQRKRSDVMQALVKADAKESRTRLVSPIDGYVQQLLVTTIGQVVTTGQPLMVVVPTDGILEVEALVENQDIAFIRPGQDAVIKVDSFPFTRYGSIKGIVKRVSPDAVDQRDAGMTSETNTQRNSNSNAISGVSQVQNLIYPVTVELSEKSIFADGRDVPLGPGMTVAVEIKTGDRRVIDYILAPLREISSRAARER